MNDISIAKRLRLNLHKSFTKTQARLHELTYFFWECTLRCNLNCLHCGSDCTRKAAPDMPLSDFLRVLDAVRMNCNPNKVMLALTGGEPLLRKDLEGCGREFTARGFPWGMVSNGYALDEKRLTSLLASGLRSLTISLDGLEESHNWLRGNNQSFHRATQAIQIAAAKMKAFDIVSCVNQKNISHYKMIQG